MFRQFRLCLAAAAALAVFAAAPIAMAQTTTGGTTSGPAAGNTVKPGEAMGHSSMSSATKQAAHGDMAAGAPGVAAKQGSESGTAPTKTPGTGQSQ